MMAKEIGYFRFYPIEWLKGDITLFDSDVQGAFILLCCYYWSKDCSMSVANAKQRLSNCLNNFDTLLNNEIVTVDDEDNIHIEFLDEQFDKVSSISRKRSKSGRLGGTASAKQVLSKPKASAKQLPIYKDNDNDKEYNVQTFESEVSTLYNLFLDNLPKRYHPKTKKQIYEWHDVIEKCHRIDEYTYEQIEDIIKWVRIKSDFWPDNFFSVMKLRDLSKKDKIKYVHMIWEQIKDKVSYGV